jgi:alkaline phosphatase D
VPDLTRRTLITSAAGAGLALALTPGTASAAGTDGADYPTALPRPFAHGVASGDPLPDRVILWTRITRPAGSTARSVTVAWEVRADPAMRGRVVARGTVTTTAARDWTVKVDAAPLQPGTTYYYRFTALGSHSLTGRTRTAVATSVRELRFGVVSCASYWSVARWDGMRRLAERGDLDLVVHCGDHVYDYPDEDEWVRARGGRFDEKDVDFRRWRTLAEVRRRYALYFADPDFVALHQQHPMFVLWDNHDLSTGDDSHPVPRAQVIQAFGEWTPTRPPSATRAANVTPLNQDLVYRSLSYGPLADLRAIDVRHAATDAERKAGSSLGAAQTAWLKQSMKGSHDRGTAWRLVVNGYPLGQLKAIDPPGGLFTGSSQGQVQFYGAWDEFDAERASLVQYLRTQGIGDNLVLTGDAHGSFVWDVTDDDTLPNYVKATGKTATGAPSSVGVEFLPTSLGRGGGTETLAATAYMQAHGGAHPYADRAGFAPYLQAGTVAAAALSTALTAGNPALQYLEWDSHGYGIVHLTEQHALLELWWQPIRQTSTTDTLGAQFEVLRGSQHATQVLNPTGSRGSRVSAPAPQAISPVSRPVPATPPPAAAPPGPQLPSTGGPVAVGVVATAAVASGLALAALRDRAAISEP